jgi:hypothetical protein
MLIHPSIQLDAALLDLRVRDCRVADLDFVMFSFSFASVQLPDILIPCKLARSNF